MQKTNHNLSQNLVLSHLNLSQTWECLWAAFIKQKKKPHTQTLMVRASIVNAVNLNAESEQDLRTREAVWHGSNSSSSCKALQEVVRTAELITRNKVPALQHVNQTLLEWDTQSYIKDCTCPAHHLLETLPYGRIQSDNQTDKQLSFSSYHTT